MTMHRVTPQLFFDGELDANGTHFRRILHTSPWSFSEAVALLLDLSGTSQEQVFEASGDDKVSVEFHGTWRDQVFTLYDWKNDFQLHIGGREALEVDSLERALLRHMETATPRAFKALATYERRIAYGFGAPVHGAREGG